MSSTGSEIWDALSARISELAERAGKAVVAVEAGHRVSASGVHWQPGVVVTAAHLVRRAETVNVLLPNGQSVTGQIAGRDNTTDVAAIRVDGGVGGHASVRLRRQVGRACAFCRPLAPRGACSRRRGHGPHRWPVEDLARGSD